MKKIKVFLKNSKLAYFFYNRFFSYILNFIGLFIRTDNKLILFNAFGGAKYDDSPKAIYEYMKSKQSYSNYKLIWTIDNPGILKDKDVLWVKNNSIKFFITALKAKYWITNSSMERGLKFKKNNTIYINTWHGSALKKLGKDTGKTVSKFRVSKADIYYIQSNYDREIFKRAFDWADEKMRLVGLPRNDTLCKTTKKEIKEIKERLKMPLNKKIILYAPTFREYSYDSEGCLLAPPIDLKKWKKELSNDYIVFFRAHYEVNKVLNLKEDDFIYNMTDYPELNDLLKISDIMISDYSSIMIDYAILERPIFSYAYDYEEYAEKRGLYVDLNKELPNGIQKEEDDLLDKIKKCDFKKDKQKTKKFKEKYIEECGHASEYIDEIILGGN